MYTIKQKTKLKWNWQDANVTAFISACSANLYYLNKIQVATMCFLTCVKEYIKNGYAYIQSTVMLIGLC